MFRFVVLFLLSTIGCAGTTGADSSTTSGTEIAQFQLENGLKVILRPIQSASHVGLVVLFDIGGDHDPLGQSGLAHAVEHVYVTAAAGRTEARTVQDYVAAYPHGWNAQTGDRYTVVATVFDTNALESELTEAADRMQSLRVTDDDLKREKPRIAAELHNMYGGIPQLAANNLAREMIRPSAVGHRKGGVIDHVSRFTAGDIQSRWQKYYKPNNATLVWSGRFDAEGAKRKIQSLFSQIESGDPPPEDLRTPKANLAKLLRVKVKPNQRDAKARVCLAYAAPAPSDGLFPAFLVLVAKMQSQAVELQSNPRQFPIQFMAIDDPSVLYVTSEVRKGETAKDTVQRLDEFVLKIANGSVEKDHLKFAKNAFAFLYETSELPGAALAGNVYGAAFALGRRGQLGIDSKKLAQDILDVRQDAIDQCRDQVFDARQRAAVVVTPE